MSVVLNIGSPFSILSQADNEETNQASAYITESDDLTVFFVHLFTCSLGQNNIGDDGAKALAEGLQHSTNLQKLK